MVICTIVVYSWGRFRGCWVGFYSLNGHAISLLGARPRQKGGGGKRGGGRGGEQTWVRKEICRLRRRGEELRVASVANG